MCVDALPVTKLQRGGCQRWHVESYEWDDPTVSYRWTGLV